MTKRYIEIIDEMIAEHEREIAKLTIARSVVTAIGEEALGGAKPSGKGAAKAVTMKHSKGKRTPRKQLIFAALEQFGRPATSREIFNQIIAMGTELPEKSIWNTLATLKAAGKLNRTKDGRYGIPPNVVTAGSGTIGEQFEPGGVYNERAAG